MPQHKKAIVIGAGIVGLAMARSLSLKGFDVIVFERNQKAVGASIRNFGMLWPIGQPYGTLYERAVRSRNIWESICNEAGIWYEKRGSLHLAYDELENDVIKEYVELSHAERPVHFLNVREALDKSSFINPYDLKGALFSEDEMVLEAREAIDALPAYLSSKYGVIFHFNTAITQINFPYVHSGKEKWGADEIYVCSGADFETLYPAVFASVPITKCKLQMMRFTDTKKVQRMGPSLCGGLSLTHYKGFESAASLLKLKQHYSNQMPDYINWGIHVMISQNQSGELTIGDSHEYGIVHDPFDKQHINTLIMDYCAQFCLTNEFKMVQSWNGIYPQMTNGATEYIQSPEPGVMIINGMGGAGMTLSFGLAEEIVAGKTIM
ncbi:MAG: TIGR03364 family FAD-dependent oxidoreductase [Ginsengibacter sp.]